MLPSKATYTTSGTNLYVYGGKAGALYKNGVRILTAGGGAGTISDGTAPDDVTKVYVYNGSSSDTSYGSSNSYNVHWHSGNGITSHKTSNTFPTVYQLDSPGGCYTLGSHTHDQIQTCARDDHSNYTCYCTHSPADETHEHTYCSYHKHICNVCHKYIKRWDGMCSADCNHHQHTSGRPYMCGDSPTNTWNLGCGYSNGEIIGYSNGSVGSCSGNSASDDAHINNEGAASAKIELDEHRKLYYTGANVSGDVEYAGSKVNLVLRDNIVVYYKRR